VTLDPQVRAYLDGIAAAGLPPAWEQPIETVRRAYAAGGGGLFGPPDPVAVADDVAIAGPGGPLPLRVYRAAATAKEPLAALVWLHGGGWAYGDLESHDALCRTLAARSGSIVVAVDYRLAPEHVFPAALEDAWTALRWAAGAEGAAHGIDGSRLAVGGDSAGGNLAAVCALRARDAGLPLRLQLLVYPVTDARFDTESYLSCDPYGLTRQAMEWFWDLYAPGALRLSPEAAPLRADSLAGVVPAHVLTAEYDVLRSDGEAYAARLAAQGVPVVHTRWAGMNHGFLRLPAVVDRATAAIDEVAAALRAALA
jgi:acetyl esterase